MIYPNSASKGVKPCLPSLFDVTLSFEAAAWWCGATAAGVIICAVGDVLFGNLGTCALVNFLPTDLAGELLAALGYAALPAKNLMLTDVPLCWLPS